MTEKENHPTQAADLRRQAEEIIRGSTDQSPENLLAISQGNCNFGDTLRQDVPTITPAITSVICQRLHELRVHQIELELQNRELRQKQEELDAARARYFDLYDLAPVGYITVSEKGLILEANLTAATILGVARGALVKILFSLFIYKEDQGIYYHFRKQLIETAEPQVCELRITTKGSQPFWAHLEATVAQDHSPDALRLRSGQGGKGGETVSRIVISDITERKKAEAEKENIEAQNRQLQKSESLGRMAGAIAHHFNNQLGVVIGNLDMALLDRPQDAEHLHSLTVAMKSAWKAAEVSGQMLTYLGQSFDKHELLDLAEVCLPILPILRAVMPEKVLLETDLPSPGPVISGNANQIQQIMTNLITNAWEAVGEEGGVIHLRVKTASTAEIHAKRRFPLGWQPQEGAYACLAVTDTGSGIAHNDLEKLFDPFFSSKFIGRGLGLPMVLGIAKAHRGAVTVESNKGCGSTFRTFFPVSGDEGVSG